MCHLILIKQIAKIFDAWYNRVSFHKGTYMREFRMLFNVTEKLYKVSIYNLVNLCFHHTYALNTYNSDTLQISITCSLMSNQLY